jgi:hypothetical protein
MLKPAFKILAASHRAVVLLQKTQKILRKAYAENDYVRMHIFNTRFSKIRLILAKTHIHEAFFVGLLAGAVISYFLGITK